MLFLDNLVQEISVVADTKAYDVIEKKNKDIAKSSISLERTMKRAFGAFAAYFSIKSLIKYADEWKNIDSILRLITNTETQRLELQEKLFKLSQDTRQEMMGTVDLYRRISTATEKLSVSENDRLKATEAINKALIIGGGTTQGNSAALVQLGQGLSANALRGQELNSILEQSPRLAQAIAEGLGMQIGDLRAYAAKNKGIKASDVMGAILRQAKQLDNEFKKVNITVGGAFVKLNNSIGRLVYGVDKAHGITEAIANGIEFISELIDRNVERISAILNLLKHIFIILVALRALRFIGLNNFVMHLREGAGFVLALQRTIATTSLAGLIRSSKALLVPWLKIAAGAALVLQLIETIQGKDTYFRRYMDTLPQQSYQPIKDMAGEGTLGATLSVAATPGIALENYFYKGLEKLFGERPRGDQNVNVTQYISTSNPQVAASISADNIERYVTSRGGNTSATNTPKVEDITHLLPKYGG